MSRIYDKKRVTQIAAAVMTAAFLCLLLVYYLANDRPRTLQRALEKIDGDPLAFSAESGFYEEGFALKLTADARIPASDDIEIRYTLDGDEPTGESLLYDPAQGIDLQMVAEEAAQAELLRDAEREVVRAEAIAAAQREEAEELPAEAENPAAAPGDVRAETHDLQAAPGDGPAETDDLQTAPEDGPAETDDPQTAPEDGLAIPPTVEEARAAWEREKWLQTSDAGVYPARAKDGIQVIPVRACLLQGEDRSRIVTRTYVIGPDVFSRYEGESPAETAEARNSGSDSQTEGEGQTRPDSTGGTAGTGLYMVSVTTDSQNLFDYDSGIMVKGSHYEEDVAKGVREDRAGNFYQTGPAWTKDGHVTLFSPQGEVLLEEDAGLMISGYSSRTLATRSFKAEASAAHGSGEEYFHLDIFRDGAAAAAVPSADRPDGTHTENSSESSSESISENGSESRLESSSQVRSEGIPTDKRTGELPDRQIDLFKKIKFRSHGVPNYHIRSVRNQYAKILTDECDFPGMVENRLGVMFLNGEFYTVIDIAPSATKDYLARLFGLHVPGAIEKFEGSDYDVYTRAKIVKLLEADLTDAAAQKALEQAVDMDNYLFYMALEVLFNNADWPFNNVTAWRYLGEEDPANPYTDGRIRFILDDMDQILSNGLHGDPARWSSELIDYLMKDEGHTFHHVMACRKYRDAFLSTVDDLLQTAFEPDHACEVLDSLYGAMKKEYLLDYGEAFWAEMEETAEITKQNVREKESLYRANIGKYMDLTDRAPVRIEASDGVAVTWNHMTVSPGESWTGEYYCGTALYLTASPSKGYRFAGWEAADGGILSEDPVYEMEVEGSEEGETQQTIRAVAEPIR